MSISSDFLLRLHIQGVPMKNYHNCLSLVHPVAVSHHLHRITTLCTVNGCWFWSYFTTA